MKNEIVSNYILAVRIIKASAIASLFGFAPMYERNVVSLEWPVMDINIGVSTFPK